MINEILSKPAIFSPDRVYRYTLIRQWDPSKPYVAFVGLNPSTATEYIDDPTVRRCKRFAFSWGYGGLIMLNIFAFRSTDPKKLYKVHDPIGPENDSYLYLLNKHAEMTVAAWGVHGKLRKRYKEVLNLLINPYCLGITKLGAPKHPLYLSKNLKPIPFNGKPPNGINNS